MSEHFSKKLTGLEASTKRTSEEKEVGIPVVPRYDYGRYPERYLAGEIIIVTVCNLFSL